MWPDWLLRAVSDYEGFHSLPNALCRKHQREVADAALAGVR